MQLYKFQFQITEEYLQGQKIERPYFAEVKYSIEHKSVKVWAVDIPFELLAYINTTGNFITEVQCAADNNAQGYGLLKPTAHVQPGVFVTVFDHIKIHA